MNEQQGKLWDAVLQDAIAAGTPGEQQNVVLRERVLGHRAQRSALRAMPCVRVKIRPSSPVRNWAAGVMCSVLPVLPIHDDVLVQVRGFKKRSHLLWCASVVALMADQHFALFPRQLIWWSQPLANSQVNPLLLFFGYPDLTQLCVSKNI